MLESGVRHAKMSHGEVDCMRKIGRKVCDENVVGWGRNGMNIVDDVRICGENDMDKTGVR